jgi:TATA-box binding protein (TBP) (component of TFIID and TFIIIB)
MTTLEADPKVPSLNIFTMTLSINLGFSINLLNIGLYLEPDSVILGIKYKFGEHTFLKGIYKTKSDKSFFNQVSLIVQTHQKKINVKLFQNGKLQLTGCKSKSDAYDVKQILLEYLSKINGEDTKTVCATSSMPIVDDYYFIYSHTIPSKCIGFTRGIDFVIGNKICDYHSSLGVYISRKSIGSHTYPIYDLNGNPIGEKKIKLFKNCKKIYKNWDIVDNLLFSGEIPIGQIEYILPLQENVGFETSKTIKYDKTVLEMKNGLGNTPVEIYSAMFSFTLPFKIDRQKLYTKLLANSYIAKFQPNRYSGVHLLLKINEEGVVVNKGTGSQVSVIFFQSGSVICSGIKNEEDIEKIYRFIQNFSF